MSTGSHRLHSTSIGSKKAIISPVTTERRLFKASVRLRISARVDILVVSFGRAGTGTEA